MESKWLLLPLGGCREEDEEVADDVEGSIGEGSCSKKSVLGIPGSPAAGPDVVS